MRSGMVMAQHQPLTMAEIISKMDLSAARLVALSACETGLTDMIQPDEFLGLPAGFLQAGAPAVVSSLWAVDDLSTALLIGEFYRRHLSEGQEPAKALRGAQLWLRDSTAAELRLADDYERLYRVSGRTDKHAYDSMKYYKNNPDIKPFAQPYYWAGFTFSGA
jgi:CHAT domain-containing protein